MGEEGIGGGGGGGVDLHHSEQQEVGPHKHTLD